VENMNANPRTGQTAITLGLSFIAGVGLILMIVAGGLGVIEGANADSETIGLVFGIGVACFIVGIASWGAYLRPWEHFDDINVPQYEGHHHDEHHDPDSDALSFDSLPE
jgi:hypothetical protein